MAHKKGAGSTKNGRDSNSKRLGIKVYGNQLEIWGYNCPPTWPDF